MPRQTRKPRVAKAKPVSAPLAPPTPVIAPSEPETGPVAPSAPVVTPEGVEIECTIPNVHLGDGRQLNRGERAFCNPVLADLIVGNGQAVYV